MAGEPEQWLSCHPVHTPLQISYPVTQVKEVCAGCHDQAYQLLQKHQTKHSALSCAKCHPAHGQLPARIAMENPTVPRFIKSLHNAVTVMVLPMI
jgi:hypothetical protein